MGKNKIWLCSVLVLLLVNNFVYSYSTSDTSSVRLRVKNHSKYKIVKLVIFNQEIKDLQPGEYSNYFNVTQLYPSIGFDITVETKKFSQRTIVDPIDKVGERLIKNMNNTLVICIDKESKKKNLSINSFLQKE